MKIKVSKEELRKHSPGWFYWADFPDFIELEGEVIMGGCIRHTRGDGKFCKMCTNDLPPLPEEIHFVYRLTDSETRLNDLTETMNRLIAYIKPLK